MHDYTSGLYNLPNISFVTSQQVFTVPYFFSVSLPPPYTGSVSFSLNARPSTSPKPGISYLTITSSNSSILVVNGQNNHTLAFSNLNWHLPQEVRVRFLKAMELQSFLSPWMKWALLHQFSLVIRLLVILAALVGLVLIAILVSPLYSLPFFLSCLSFLYEFLFSIFNQMAVDLCLDSNYCQNEYCTNSNNIFTCGCGGAPSCIGNLMLPMNESIILMGYHYRMRSITTRIREFV